MRRFALVAVVALVFGAPLGAQEPIPPEIRPALCADWLLGQVTESRTPYTPYLHLGLATRFLGCAYRLPPFVGPVLDAMQADIDLVDRYREQLGESAPELHRHVVCSSWVAVYAGIYEWTLYEYGSDAIDGYRLPEPAVHADACERWVEGRP